MIVAVAALTRSHTFRIHQRVAAGLLEELLGRHVLPVFEHRLVRFVTVISVAHFRYSPSSFKVAAKRRTLADRSSAWPLLRLHPPKATHRPCSRRSLRARASARAPPAYPPPHARHCRPKPEAACGQA